ncbi:putative membrane protein [Minicystis rosea]|nr:putative membrane protein [Minicystis rosea]
MPDPSLAEEWLKHLLLLEDTIFVLARPFGVPSYDFDFERSFACKHPIYLPEGVEVAARVGPIADYPGFFEMLETTGIRLVNDPDASFRANDLRGWYPRIADLTARSLWFEGEPDLDRVEREIGFPVFVKTVQQTLRHRHDVSIVADRASLARAVDAYRSDPVLGAQPLVFREYLSLAPLPSTPRHAERIPGGREIRSFFWRGRIVGAGAYWSRDGGYTPSPAERTAALTLAEEAARRVDVPFLVVDAAQRIDGSWVVIETNDAQESGYTGVSPMELWRSIIEVEREIG